MKKQYFLTFLLFTVLVVTSFHGVHAQTNGMSLGGDEICGASSTTECSLQDAKRIVVGAVYNFIIPIGSALLVVLIMWRVLSAFKARIQGNSNAYKEATKEAGNAVIGLMVILLVIAGGYIAAVKYIGAQDWATTFFNFFSASFIPHAYAATNGTILPNPLSVTSLYDLLLAIVRIFIRWFVFPGVVVMWIWTGFSYVAAQGAPEKIALAHKWLLYALITTVVILTTEGFLFAVRGTIEQIVPQQQVSTANNNGATRNPNTPASPAVGAVSSCGGQPVGTACTITGTTRQGACDYSDEGVYSCYVK